MKRPRCLDDTSRPCHHDPGSHGPREIHDHPVSADPLDLAAIEARAHATTHGRLGLAVALATEDVPALVAEVRRLRAELEQAVESR